MSRSIIHRPWSIPAVLLCAILALAQAPAPRQPAARPEQPTLTPAQQAEARALLDRLRFANPTHETTAEVVNELLAIGDYGPVQLAIYLSRDVTARQERYLRDFEKAASRALRARWPDDIEKQVTSLRESVLNLTRSDALTKEKIKAISDPAMKKLEELLTISREDVLAAEQTLAQAREALVAQTTFLRRAAERVPDERRDKVVRVKDLDRIEEALVEFEALSALLATPMYDDDRKVLLANMKIAATMDAEEAAGIEKLNFMRIFLGLNAQAIDPKLCDAARDHSKDMREHKFFAHESPLPGKKSPWDRARNFGTSAGAENIFAGSGKGKAAIEAWWYSPGHHKNMLGGHRRVGLGRDGEVWTQMFG